ncbi:hypothetical protein [Abyssogena phaseoliformis symbiont]|uniref:hypothetical protein n=1 Tax=Abyssogena phaseoliformis symbiont TaxID=596095 RepID=UPI001915D32D|nr:hypothetical protein [Abyssogena phaseoliformis symbiont]
MVRKVVLNINGAVIADGNSVKLDYTKPSSGAVLEDTQGNDAAILTNLIIGTEGSNTLAGSG